MKLLVSKMAPTVYYKEGVRNRKCPQSCAFMNIQFGFAFVGNHTSEQTGEVRGLRPILNFAPRGKLLPPGAKLSPRGEFVP
jgi:hypothetical protein